MVAPILPAVVLASAYAYVVKATAVGNAPRYTAQPIARPLRRGYHRTTLP
jgi:hypothetical protein